MKLSHTLIMTVVVFALLFVGCDSTGAGGGGGGGGDSGQDAGTLTAGISGVPDDLESTTEGDNDLLFAAFVFNAGGDPLDDSDDNWVALVAEEIVDGSASGTAFQTGDDTLPEWVGTAGESHDVYYTVYCVTLQEDGPPQKGGQDFYMSNPEYVHGTVDWQSPITYQQDGDHSLTSSFEEYLSTAHVEFVAQGAIGLIPLVMDSLPDGGPPAVPGELDLDPAITGITVAMTGLVEEPDTLYVDIGINIDGYTFPETDPTATATGDIALSIVAPITNEAPQAPEELSFTTTNLVLSQGEDSTAVEMDVTASVGANGFEAFTGTFTVDGAEHDLSILTEMYDIP